MSLHGIKKPTGSNGHGQDTQARCKSWRVAVAAISRITSYSCLTCLQCCLSARTITVANHPRGNGVLREKPRQSSLNRGNSALLGLRPAQAALSSSFDPHYSSSRLSVRPGLRGWQLPIKPGTSLSRSLDPAIWTTGVCCAMLVRPACQQPPRCTDFTYHKAPSSSDGILLNFSLRFHTRIPWSLHLRPTHNSSK